MQLELPIANYNGKPDIENGYTRIANELLEAIASFNFSGRHMSILIAIIRMTYGYGKKSDALSGWQISKITNIDRAHISRALKELIAMNVIIKHENGRKSHGIMVNEISINKYYDTWLTVAETATVAKRAPLPKSTLTVAETATKPLPKEHTHKERNKTKESISKTSIPKEFSISERVIKWANENKFNNLEKHLSNFILVCESKNYKYSNWDSAFMRAISDNWAKVDNKQESIPDWKRKMI
jgi:phage replication O-like protein O